jgi:signal transduction histidine kinase
MTSIEPNRSRAFEDNLRTVYVTTDQMFFWIFVAEWAFAVALAIVVSPYSWAGRVRTIHVHVETAISLGGLITAPALALTRFRPGWWLTRHTVAVVQVLWSAIFIHLTGGRIETHFHIFGSLAFIAFYRDWRPIVTATVVVAADHMARGFLWPDSVYGIANPEWWRFLEHAGWVVFEDIVLALGCKRSLGDMAVVADREAELETLNAEVEQRVTDRTHELSVANRSLAEEMQIRGKMEVELRQAQKLEAVGRLASGIAHEINTPLQFVGDNLYYLDGAHKDLMRVLGDLLAVKQSVLDGAVSVGAANAVSLLEDEVDLPYMIENVPEAIDRAREGLANISVIVKSMKEFAHPGQAEMTTVDLNQAIASTLVVARSEYKGVAELETDFGFIDPVACFVGEVNQAILNIVVNAAHAIGGRVVGSAKKGIISVRTWQDGEQVVISIADTGGGIPEGVREHIFEPFFTTKGVGKGTGQGLAIARSVVVDKHCGSLSFETEVGKGTTFLIRLPVVGLTCADTDVGVAA